MLTLENIRWSAPDGKPVLTGIHYTFEDGKLIAVTGPNGSGKTTLARIIAGLEKPLSGRILLNGEDITELNVTERARKGISYAFQQPVRFKGLTVRQLIETAAGGKIDECGLCDVLSKVGLCAHEYCNREADATLSGGEMKRIEIATVLARHTNLTVFDAPEAGIDLWSFSSLIQTFQDIRRELKGTMIIISHQERILRAADEILLVDGGSVAESGPAEHMLNNVLRADSAVRACHKQEAVFHE